jgi:hypothetical protein
LAFYLVDHGLSKFHSKLLNLDPIFGSVVHLSSAYNFCNYGFLTCHIKSGFAILVVPKRGKIDVFFVKWLPRALCIMPPLKFSQLGDLVGRPDPKFEELSRHAAIYCIIFEINPFKF